MREVFVLEDILNALIELEVYGDKLYTNLADNAKDLETKNLFTELADQEMKHKAIYEKFKDELVFKSDINEDYQAYLISLVKSNVNISDLKIKAYTYDQALNIGIQLEKDTIIFLNELNGIIEPAQSAIKDLIDEEKKHLMILLQLKGA